MKREELLYQIEEEASYQKLIDVLRAVVELHKPVFAIANGVEGPKYCQQCADGRGYATYPCPTIQAIEKELR
jgi:hypothetical protein